MTAEKCWMRSSDLQMQEQIQANTQAHADGGGLGVRSEKSPVPGTIVSVAATAMIEADAFSVLVG